MVAKEKQNDEAESGWKKVPHNQTPANFFQVVAMAWNTMDSGKIDEQTILICG